MSTTFKGVAGIAHKDKPHLKNKKNWKNLPRTNLKGNGQYTL